MERMRLLWYTSNVRHLDNQSTKPVLMIIGVTQVKIRSWTEAERLCGRLQTARLHYQGVVLTPVREVCPEVSSWRSFQECRSISEPLFFHPRNHHTKQKLLHASFVLVSSMNYTQIFRNMLKICPLSALVIGCPLAMTNDRHQGAKCPMQDTVGIFLQQEGNNICLTAERYTDSSVSQTHLVLKSQSAVSKMHQRESSKQPPSCRIKLWRWWRFQS